MDDISMQTNAMWNFMLKKNAGYLLLFYFALARERLEKRR